MIRKHIRSSTPPPDDANTDPPAPRSPASRTRHVAIEIINTTLDKEFQNLIATDLLGHYPITSLQGHKYLFVMLDTDSNFINAVPIKNRSAPELLKGFKHCHKYLKNAVSVPSSYALTAKSPKNLSLTLKLNPLEQCGINARYCTGDISNMYLCSTLDNAEYVRFPIHLILPNIIAHYKLQTLISKDYVYAQSKRRDMA